MASVMSTVLSRLNAFLDSRRQIGRLFPADVHVAVDEREEVVPV